jgi:hypothetical protein
VIRRDTENDHDMRILRDTIQNGDLRDIDACLQARFKKPIIGRGNSIEPEDLTVVEGCVVVCGKTWLPENLYEEALELLHMGHRGLDFMMSKSSKRMLLLARDEIYARGQKIYMPVLL